MTDLRSWPAILYLCPVIYARLYSSTTSHTYWAILELYNQATKKVGKQENVLTIDLAHELEKNSDFFYDRLHFTNAGATEVAKIIYNHLRPYLMENYRSFPSQNMKDKEIKITRGRIDKGVGDNGEQFSIVS